MSRKYLGVLILALALAVAGCTCFSNRAPSVIHTGEKIAPTVSFPSATASPVAQVAGQAPEEKPFDVAKARWVEYKMAGYSNGQPCTYNMKLEYGSGSANGAQTQSIKRTITSNDASSMSVLGNRNLFNSHVSSTQSSTTSGGALVPFDRIKSDDPVLYADRIAGGPEGSESVTVPKGTYDCKKYSGSFKSSDSTYWGAPGVPVPVKIYTACDGATLELVDWG